MKSHPETSPLTGTAETSPGVDYCTRGVGDHRSVASLLQPMAVMAVTLVDFETSHTGLRRADGLPVTVIATGG